VIRVPYGIADSDARETMYLEISDDKPDRENPEIVK